MPPQLLDDPALIELQSSAFVRDPVVNGKLNSLMNSFRTLPERYRLPKLISLYAPSLFWNSKINYATINENKIQLRTDLTEHTINTIEPIIIQRTSYFHSLITNDLALKKWRMPGSRQVSIDFSDLTYRNGRLIPLSDSQLSNHIGVSTIVVTKDLKLNYQEQGKDNVINAGRLAPSASGSLDWDDIGKLHPKNFRDLIVLGLERELREELSAQITPKSCHTYLTGSARDLQRGAKPEFFGLTLLRQSAIELRVI